MTDLPDKLDDLIEYVAERVDPVEMARVWYRELTRIDTPEAAARRRMVGALLEVIDEQRERIDVLVKQLEEIEEN